MDNQVLFSTVLNMCLLVVLAYVLTRNRWGRRVLVLDSWNTNTPAAEQLLRKIGLGVIMGAFCMISNTVGFMVEGSIPNSRVIGAMASGMLGGPIPGMIAATMGAVHRYLGEPTRVSTPACVLATMLQGIAGSTIWYLKKKRIDYSRWLLLGTTAVAEIIHMWLIYTMVADKPAAIAILNAIAFPMVLVNPVGMLLLFSIIRDVITERDQQAAVIVARSFSTSERCIPYLQVHVSPEREERNVQKILDIILEDRVFAGAAIVRGNHFLGRSEAFGELPEELDSLDPFGSLHRKFLVILEDIDVPSEEKEILVALIPRESYTTELAETYARSLANFMANEYRLSLMEEQRDMLRKAELQTLQSQINPHFLFNALNTISFFCREKPDKARELLMALSRYFRNTLQNVDEMTPLAKELEHVKAYLMLEEARFEDRLQVTIEADPEALDIAVPNLILQPLVENAVKHGAMTQRRGTVDIRIFRENESVRVKILDNGPGVPEAVVQGLATGVKSQGGLGMTNVHQRLLAIWGPEAGLRCSKENGVNCVEFVIADRR